MISWRLYWSLIINQPAFQKFVFELISYPVPREFSSPPDPQYKQLQYAMTDFSAIPEDGQFDDAPDDNAGVVTTTTTTATTTATASVTDLSNTDHARIDDDAALLAWSDDAEEDEDDDEDELNEEDFDDARVEDEDWEMAERGESPHSNVPCLEAQRTDVTQTSPSSTIASSNMSPYAPATHRPLPSKQPPSPKLLARSHRCPRSIDRARQA
jgi:hypothetical protein